MPASPGFVEVREGATRLRVPATHTTHGPASRAKAAGVFYNRAAAVGRDVSVLYMRARHGGKELRSVDVLAGLGARSVRWAVEAGLRGVTINDRSPAAAEAIRRNLALNDIEEGAAEVTAHDAHVLLAEGGFQHIELDPYGTPAPFLDAAFCALGRRSGVSFTATDTAALCGASPEPCLRRYAAMPTRVEELCHEAGLRILIAHAIREAAKHDQAAMPVLSASREHYLRVYVETRRLSLLADKQLALIRWLIHCPSCLHRSFEDSAMRACPSCGERVVPAGPMWSGPLLDGALLKSMEDLRPGAELAKPRAVERDLGLWVKEQEADGLPWHLHELARFAGVREPPDTERAVGALRSMGHAASPSHLDGRFIRTAAPAKDVLQAVREASARGKLRA